MSTEIKRLPADWSKDLGIDVLDPDGWRCDGTPWGLAITEQDFRRRAAMSTMREVTTPAPLDKSTVRVGDTVTVTVAALHDTPEFEITGKVYGGQEAIDRAVGDYTLMHDRLTLTDHQPAPKPEWKPGTTGTATVRGVECVVVMRLHPNIQDGEGGYAWASRDLVDGKHKETNGYDGTFLHTEDDVTDFVAFMPDETRPLPTVEALADAMHDDHLPGGLPRLSRENRINLARVVLASLRGESR